MLSPLCPYRHVFGKEREGVHSIRVFDIAVVDLGLTVIAAVILARFLKLHVLVVFAVLMIVAVVAHRLFCVNTTVNRFLFGTV